LDGYWIVVQTIQTTLAMLLKLARCKIKIADHYPHVGRQNPGGLQFVLQFYSLN
jgi:hypothetical protein